MVYFIIFCAIALILGSWMWVMPTPREKALATLRQKAIMAGFQVKFVTAETYQNLLGTPASKLQPQPQTQIVRYSWQGKSPNSRSAKEKHQLCVFSEDAKLLAKEERIGGGTASETFQSATQALAEELEGLLAVEVQDTDSKRRLSFYWLEQGNVARVDFHSSIFEQLKTCPF